MKMFNRTTHDKQTRIFPDYNQDLSNKYKRRVSGANKHNLTATRRGFSGFYEPDFVSVNKMKELNQLSMTPTVSAKPILSNFKKKDDRPLKLNFLNAKSSLRQTATGFTTQKQKQGPDQRFCQTAVHGFGLNDRPMSKQQSRNNKSNIRQFENSKEVEDDVDFDIEDVESNVQDMDEEDRVMISNFHKLQNQNEIVHRQQRPQTSKGFRRKVTSNSDLDMSPGENLLEELKLAPKLRGENNLDEIKIPIRSMYNDRHKNWHPSSAHPKNQTKMSKQFDELFKVNTSSPKKNSVDVNSPFESLIGSEFLSLFANGKE